MRPQFTSVESRFWSKVDKSNPDRCWLWTSTKAGRGYGSFRIGQRQVYAHRLSYEMTYGPIPEGMYVCHSCDTPPCVRPDHLFIGTPQENYHDARRKGRVISSSRLTTDDILEIRRLAAYGLKHVEIARRFNIKRAHAWGIVTGRSWSHVGGPHGTLPGRRGAHSTAKLTLEQVHEIRSLASTGMPNREISERFGISYATVWEIVTRRTWRSL